MAGRPRLLTPAQEQDLVKWWLSPRTVYEKARELRISTSTLTDYLIRKEQSYERPRRRQCRLGRHER